jgi:hypothetical protein
MVGPKKKQEENRLKKMRARKKKHVKKRPRKWKNYWPSKLIVRGQFHPIHEIQNEILWMVHWWVLARVNQQPPMHQLRMRLLKLFWGWTKNTSSLAQSYWFFILFSTLKVFPPTYLPPPIYVPPPTSHLPPLSYVPHLILHSLHRQSSGVVGVRAKPR